MRSLRGVGVLFSLLIVGVLGGLMAPLSSEADPPSLTIRVDSASFTTGRTQYNPATLPEQEIEFDALTGSAIVGGVACDSTDSTAGYTHCYKIKTYEENSRLYGPTNRRFKVMNALNQTARVLIVDNNGLEKFVLSGVQFVPYEGDVASGAWITGTDAQKAEVVTMTITMNNLFNIVPNDVTDGTSSFYRFGLSVAGVFKSSPTPLNNTMQMSGKGKFDGATVRDIKYGVSPATNIGGTSSANTGPGAGTRMFFKVVGPVVTDVRLNKEQASVYPSFACNNGLASTPRRNPITNVTDTVSGAKCTADITLTLKFELYGGDIVVLDNSSRACGGNCGTPGAPACFPKGRKKGLDALCEGYFAGELVKDNNLAPFPDAINCTPEVCNGTIRNLIQVSPAPVSSTTFSFNGFGPDISDFGVPTDVNGNGEADPPFINVVTGRGGSVRVISIGEFNGYFLKNVNCVSLNGTTIKAVDFTEGDSGSPNKGPLTIHAIGNTDPPTLEGGDTLTCTWIINK